MGATELELILRKWLARGDSLNTVDEINSRTQKFPLCSRKPARENDRRY